MTEPSGFTGAWLPDDTRLDQVELLPLPTGTAPEDVAVDLQGRLVAGGQDGRIWRWPAGATSPDLLAQTGGRPLGIEVDPRDGSLIVCDAYRGLLRVLDDGTIAHLASTVAGTPILFCNNAAVARDGTVYFSDSSTRYPLSDWRRDLLKHQPNGRLLRYHPDSGEVSVILDGLFFPNGVALTPDESAVMLVETTTHRLLRVPLDGGDPVVLADLPAYPDNMSAVGDGTYWIALPSSRLPGAVTGSRPARYGLVALVDGDGIARRTVHGPSGEYAMITGVRQHGSTLWMGSLTESGVARIAL